jgi:ribosomal protein S4
VNGTRQSKPRFEVKEGSVIEIRIKSAEQKGMIQAALELAKKRPEIQWLQTQGDQTEGLAKGTFIRQPNRDELSSDFKDRESEVIQFYSN